MKYVNYIDLLCFVVVISYNQFWWNCISSHRCFSGLPQRHWGNHMIIQRMKKKMVSTLSKKTNRLVDSLIRGSAAYWYHQYHWDWYLSTDTHIDTLISFLLININIMFFMLCKKYIAEKYCSHTLDFQAGKLKFFGTPLNWVVSYIAYTKFHSPRPVFHSSGQIFTRIGER